MSVWLRAPLLRLCIFFILGILIIEMNVFGVPTTFQFLSGLLASFLLVFLKTKYTHRQINGMALCLCMMFGGGIVARLHQEHQSTIRYSATEESEVYLMGTVHTNPEQKKNSIQLQLSVQQIWSDSSWHSTSGKILCYLANDTLEATNLAIGDQLLIHSEVKKIKPPLNPGAFDYRKFMHRKGIEHQVYCYRKNWTVLKGSASIGFMDSLSRLRSSLLNKIEQQLEAREFGVISALSLGDKTYLDKETASKYKSAGTMHLLAVSGLHVGLIYVVLLRLLSFFHSTLFGRIASTLIIISLLWGYAGLTGGSPSVLRAATMFTFLSLAGLYSRKPNSYNLLALSAMCLLVCNPLLLFEVGFQLSYSAVFAILFIQPIIEHWWSPSNRILNYCWQLSTVSLAAQIGTFPISIYYFHSFPTYFLLANIFVIPLATLTLYSSILFYCLSWIAGVADITGWITQKLCWVLNEFVALTQKLPSNQVESLHLSMLEVAYILGLSYAFFSYISTTRFKWLRVSLGFLLILGVSRLVTGWGTLQQESLVIHHISGGSAISIIRGDQAYLYTDLEEDDLKLSYAVQGRLSACGIDEKRCINVEFDAGKHQLIEIGNLEIQLVSSEWDSSTIPLTRGVLWLRADPEIDWPLWSKHLKSNTIIADGSCSRYWLRKNRDQAKRNGLAIQSTWETGAWSCSSFERGAAEEHNPRILPIVSIQ